MSAARQFLRVAVCAAIVPLAYAAAFFSSLLLCRAIGLGVHSDGMWPLVEVVTIVAGTAGAFFGARWTWRALGGGAGSAPNVHSGSRN
jgi:hypothetical protein